jgi:hypothetical protein
MTLGNMRALGARGLNVRCFNPKCLHEVRLGVDDYPGDMLVRDFGARMVCAICGMVGADARPNWLEIPERESLTGKQFR